SAPLGRVANAVQHLLDLGRIAEVAPCQVRGPEDRSQQIVEVVRQPACELSQRFHLLRPEQLLARLLQPQLGYALLRHIASDLGEADQLAALLANGIDDDARPEPRAVLAHAPPLGLVAPGLP